MATVDTNLVIEAAAATRVAPDDAERNNSEHTANDGANKSWNPLILGHNNCGVTLNHCTSVNVRISVDRGIYRAEIDCVLYLRNVSVDLHISVGHDHVVVNLVGSVNFRNVGINLVGSVNFRNVGVDLDVSGGWRRDIAVHRNLHITTVFVVARRVGPVGAVHGDVGCVHLHRKTAVTAAR